MTAEELYAKYDLEYVSLYRSEDLEIIRDYDYARKYASMFRYVAESDYDDTILEKRRNSYQEEADSAEAKLLNGYNLPLSEIYEAEAAYVEANERLQGFVSSAQVIDVDDYYLSAEDVPSYSDYANAMSNKQLVDMMNNLGEADELSVVNGVHLVDDYDERTVTYTVLDLSPVVSLFNGYVSSVTEDTVTINHYNGIVSSYKGLTPAVEVDAVIGQNMLIGYSSSRLSVRVKIGDTFIDVYDLLEGRDEEF